MFTTVFKLLFIFNKIITLFVILLGTGKGSFIHLPLKKQILSLKNQYGAIQMLDQSTHSSLHIRTICFSMEEIMDGAHILFLKIILMNTLLKLISGLRYPVVFSLQCPIQHLRLEDFYKMLMTKYIWAWVGPTGVMEMKICGVI